MEKLEKPTFYFIGVTTTKSSIMKVFPLWMKALKLPDVEIRGFDVPPVGGPVERYRAIVQHIKEEENALGALVTTHKIAIVREAGDLFDRLDRYAEIFGEISSISKKGGRLYGHAKDPVSSGLALEALLPDSYWVENPDAVAFIMGAGGSGIALSAYLMKEGHGINLPSRIIISSRGRDSLAHCKRVHDQVGRRTEVEYREVTDNGTDVNDRIVKELPRGSLIVNATGMGKDTPGSPVSAGTLFPQNGFVWEFNYRGSLEFLHHAEGQRKERNLTVEDGWRYFIYGWTQVIGEVFDFTISDREIERLCCAAREIVGHWPAIEEQD
jgi:shikimate 5-dehydrogenase